MKYTLMRILVLNVIKFYVLKSNILSFSEVLVSQPRAMYKARQALHP